MSAVYRFPAVHPLLTVLALLAACGSGTSQPVSPFWDAHPDRTRYDGGGQDGGAEDRLLHDSSDAQGGNGDTADDQGPADATTCQSNCSGQECGDDGCGGSCGACPYPRSECLSGICHCLPECQGAICGTDGCGGSCGTCAEDTFCTVGRCVERICNDDGWCWENPLPQGHTLYGAWASSPDDVYLAGAFGTVLHWNGKDWQRMLTGTWQNLYAIAGQASNDLLAVGKRGVVTRFDGVNWTVLGYLMGDVGDVTGAFDAVAEWDNGCYLVGGQKLLFGHEPLWRCCGTECLRVQGPFSGLEYPVAVTAIWRAPDGTGRIVTRSDDSSFTLQSTTSLLDSWSQVAEFDHSVTDLDGYQPSWNLGGAESGDPGAYGGADGAEVPIVGYVSSSDGAMVGSSTGLVGWLWESVPAQGALHGIEVVDKGNVLAVGEGGSIVRLADGQWKAEESGTSARLLDVYSLGTQWSIAVGEAGTLRLNEGAGWQGPEPVTQAIVVDVLALADGRVYALSKTGQVLRNDGDSWTVETQLQGHSFVALWGETADRIFVVGAVGSETGGIWYKEQHAWYQADIAVAGSMRDVWGAEGQAFAASDGGAILHFVDGIWHQEALPGGYRCIEGGWAAAADSGFAVGYSFYEGLPVVLRYEAETWTDMDTNHTLDDAWLFGVWGANASDVYVVGETLYYNGKAMDEPVAAIGHWDGSTWKRSALGQIPGLRAIWGSGPEEMYAVGASGALYHRTTLSWAGTLNLTGNSLYSISGNDKGVWAVGEGGTILRRFSP